MAISSVLSDALPSSVEPTTYSIFRVEALPEESPKGLAASTVNDFFEFLEGQMIDGVLPQRVTLAPEQVRNLQAALRAETGPLQLHAATPELMASKGPGYVGCFLGVDIFLATV